ncbi:hypothetical protein, partial [Sporomusa sp.]|uniref:hypothetical protein n=1 Tax=Sporomusa sp. TaxID=2078658 RepID=UPI002C4F1A50
SHVPQQWDLYSFGETSKVVKPFRVLSISQDQDLRRKISCIEYIEAVYTEASDIPEVNYSALETTTEISNVSVAEETYLQKDGTMASNLNVAWSIPRDKLVSGYKVLYSSDNGQTWSEWATGITALSTKIIGVKTQTTYLVKVCTISYVGVVSNGIVSISVYVTGKDAYPSDVAGLSANISPSDCTKITLTWPAVTDIDLRGYQLMEGSTVLTPTPISDTQYIYTATQSRVHNFSVRAIDNSGNPSEIPATESISIIVEPTQVAGFSVVIQETDRSKLLLSWTANSEKDIAYYEIRTGNTDWDAATVIATQLKATSYLHSLTAEGSQTFMIRAYNVSGKDSLIESSKTVQVILRPDTPIGLVVEQDPQNRSIAILSWNASPGKDIEGYQITVGSQIYFTRELFYRYTLPTSGTYNFSIRAKTVAANYSNAANISLTAMIDPYDVTGFAAQQSITDRTIVTLIWDNPISKDVAYFEIRMGNNWDTGQVIASRATGTFHEVQVLDENRHTFFIKALSVAGNYSQNAAEVEGIFNLNPSPVSNIKISQNPNDRSQLIITWTGISESDLAFYDVRIGYEWDTATKIAETKETRWTHQTDNTGDIKAMIKSKNAAGFYSDEVYEHYYSTVEPGTVTGLVAIQNGEYVELFWDKHSESDVVAYEITEGASFDMGQLVVSGVTTTEYKVKVDTERNYYYHVKAINRALKYSQIAASYGVYVGNLPVKNIIQEYDEIVLQTGTKYNAEFGPSLINWSNMGGRFSDYPTTKFSDVGGQTVLKLKQVNLLDTPTKRIPAVYNNYPANITSSLIISPETFKGQPIHRLTLTPINATGVTQLSTIAVGHGFWYNTSLQYLMNESFLASIYWRTTTSKPVSMSGTSSNISGWTSIGTTDAGGGWSRTVSKRLYATTQSDYKYWSIMCPTVTLNEAVTIEFTCPQIEVNTSVTEFGTYFSTGEYTCQTKDMNQVITANITSDFRSTVILRGIGSAVLQIRTSQDGTNWLAWQDFKPAQYTFRYLDARVLLATNDPTNTPEVNHLSLRIDVPDTDKAGTITIPIGGVTVNYGHTYYEIPVLTPMAIGDNRFPVILTKTKSSFTAKITDRAGTDTGGALDWRSKGY